MFINLFFRRTSSFYSEITVSILLSSSKLIISIIFFRCYIEIIIKKTKNCIQKNLAKTNYKSTWQVYELSIYEHLKLELIRIVKI